MSNFQKPPNNPYSDTYNLRWRNHPNFSYKNQNPIRPPPLGFQPQPYEKKFDLEELLKNYINSNETRFKNQEDMISKRSHDYLPSNIEKNLKEEINAITLRSDKELEEVENKSKEDVIEETCWYFHYLLI